MGLIIEPKDDPVNRRYAKMQYNFYAFLVLELFMDKTYGPCWRCEGMGV